MLIDGLVLINTRWSDKYSVQDHTAGILSSHATGLDLMPIVPRCEATHTLNVGT